MFNSQHASKKFSYKLTDGTWVIGQVIERTPNCVKIRRQDDYAGDILWINYTHIISAKEVS